MLKILKDQTHLSESRIKLFLIYFHAQNPLSSPNLSIKGKKKSELLSSSQEDLTFVLVLIRFRMYR